MQGEHSAGAYQNQQNIYYHWNPQPADENQDSHDRQGKGIVWYAAEARSPCKQVESQSLMRAAMSQLNLSARAYNRILKLSRTIADLAGSEEIQSPHLAEALQYRPKLML